MRRNAFLGVALLLAAVFIGGCSGGGDESTDSDSAEKKTSSALQTIAEQAAADIDLDTEAPELKSQLEAAGYTVTSYVEFPAQESSVKGRMLLYAAKSGSRGGVVFLKKPTGNVVHAKPSWHWYFGDLQPTAISKQEFNEDGLWDIRIETKSGENLELIQDEMFTLSGRNRPGWVAMNGRCSAPADINSMMWMVFDGDTTTAWRSAIEADGGAYLEMDTPFGVKEGTLVMHSGAEDQPMAGKVLADGKSIKTFELSAGSGEKTVELGQDALSAKTIRVEFDSAHGGGASVAVTEVEIR